MFLLPKPSILWYVILFSRKYYKIYIFNSSEKWYSHLFCNGFKVRLGFIKCSFKCAKPHNEEIVVWSFRKYYFLNNYRQKKCTVFLKTFGEDNSLGSILGYWFNKAYSQETVPDLNPPWYNLNSFSLFLTSNKL